MNTTMLLQGVELVNAKGEKKDAAEALTGKLLALYFAADWCPDCRDFQPALNVFYKEVNTSAQVLDVVFVGSDASAADQEAHFTDKQGDWWMIPFEHDARNALKRQYGVCAGKEAAAVGVTDRKNGIPSLVVVQANGDVVDLMGADRVERDGASAINAWLA